MRAARLTHAPALEGPAVGGHLVALGQADDVAGDEAGGVDLVDLPAAPHLDLLGQQPAQGLEGPFGAVGLPEREEPH